jgi:hypothetical protein
MLVSLVVHVLMSAQWVLFLRVTFTRLMLTCVLSAALVQMYAQVKRFLKAKLQICFYKSPRALLGDFLCVYSGAFATFVFYKNILFFKKCYLDIAKLKKKYYLCSAKELRTKF